MFPIVGQPYTLKSKQLDVQNCINWYVITDSTGKYPSGLFPRPGSLLWTTHAGNENRGAIVYKNELYVVIDNKLYVYHSNKAYQELGTLKTSSGLVRMVGNETQIFISDAKNGYVYQTIKTDAHTRGFHDITVTESLISDPTFNGTGLDDMETGGTYTASGDKTYVVKITTVSTIDKFSWSDDGGDTFKVSGVTITGSAQTLEYGITVTFSNTNSHTLNDKWTFQVSSDSSFYVPVIPTTQDGYGVFTKQNSNRFYISAIDDFLSINALDYARANTYSNILSAAISINQELFLIGENYTEIWYDIGAELFPFQRREGIVIPYGTKAPYAIASFNNILIFLATNNEGISVIACENYQALPISTEPIDKEFLTYNDIENAFAYTEQYNGHHFYVLTFPHSEKTWCYDFTTKMWHERRTRRANENPLSNEYIEGRYLANWHVYWQNKHLIGDFNSGNIYELSDDVYKDYNELIICERTTQHVDNKQDLFTLNQLEIEVERGQGLTSGQGSIPQMMLQISKDGGYRWGKELWRTATKIGEYKARVLWARLGQMRTSGTLRIRNSDPYYKSILGAVVKAEKDS